MGKDLRGSVAKLYPFNLGMGLHDCTQETGLEDMEFKASLIYLVNSRSVQATILFPVSEQKNNKKSYFISVVLETELHR